MHHKNKMRAKPSKSTPSKNVLIGALSVGTVLAVAAVRRARRIRNAKLVPREVAATFTERTSVVEGIWMRWLEHGQGWPVVFVHGIPTSPELWRKVMPRLRGARALAWEMVGYGESIPEGRGRDLSVAKQADYLAAWLEQLGLGPAILVGHDLGGGVVQIAAARYPELCAGLLFINAISYDSWPIPEVKAIRAAGGLVKRFPDAAIRFIHNTLFHLGHDDPEMAREASAFHWQKYARHGAAEAFVHQVRSLDVRDTLAVQDALPRLKVPARVVWGAADQFQRVRYGERLARDLGTPLRRIEGGKHFTPEDHPERLAEALNDLVSEVQAAAGTG